MKTVVFTFIILPLERPISSSLSYNSQSIHFWRYTRFFFLNKLNVFIILKQ